MKMVTRKIEVELTKEEKAKLAEEAGKVQANLHRMEINFTEYKKDEKRKIDDLKSMIVTMLRSIDRGVRDMNIECEEHIDLFGKEINYFHKNELVDKRKMALEEFDSLVEKMCNKVVNEDKWEKEYYLKDKIVIKRKMTTEQIELYKMQKAEAEDKTKGQQTLIDPKEAKDKEKK